MDGTLSMQLIKAVLDNRSANVTNPELVAEFNKIHEKYFGPLPEKPDRFIYMLKLKKLKAMYNVKKWRFLT